MQQNGNPYPYVQPKDPNTAFLIELVGGLFGFLGLGHFYVGRTNDGVLRLVLFLAYNLVAYAIIAVSAGLTIGISACICGPIQLAIQLGVAFWSANTLKNEMMAQPFSAGQPVQPRMFPPSAEPAMSDPFAPGADSSGPQAPTDISTGDQPAAPAGSDGENTGNS